MHLSCEKHTMLVKRQENTRSNIDFITLSIVVIIQQNYHIIKSMKQSVFSNIYKTDYHSKYVIPLRSKNLRKDYNKRATTHDAKIHRKQNTGFYKSKTRTNVE